VIEALAHPEASGVKCVIAGEGEERGSLEQAIASRGLAPRVTLIGRIDDGQMLEHLARCRAVCFPPFDEDYGFVTVEAFASRKAVITCSDSGGPAELVTDGVDGKVCAPRADALAVAFGEVMQDRAQAERLGRAGLEKVAEMTWARAVRRLLA
jgi:glycosyltransferase involved in cell wall biosynthesis